MTRRSSLTWASTASTTAVIAVVTGAAAMIVDGPSRIAVFAAGAAGVLGAVALRLVRAGQCDEPDSEAREPDGHRGYPCRCADPGRRKLLRRGAISGGFLLGAAALVPLWGATQRAERRLARTSWSTGSRLVDDRDRLVRAGDLEEGAFTTVWPAGHRGQGDSPAVLIRLHPGRKVTTPGRDDWIAEGHVAYSKLCTHMGCPVGLYQARADLLVCPCHQATFDVLRGAAPIHGPANRALPQLPLSVDEEGYLVATDDFAEPVGPAYWSRPS